MIEAHMFVVDICMSALSRKLPCYDGLKEELRSSGFVGLTRAANRFEPGRGASFRTYAWPVIRGAMLDYLRSLDLLTRYERSQKMTIERRNVPMEDAIDQASKQSVQQLDNAIAIDRLLLCLSPRSAQMVRMFYFDGCEQKQIGRCFGVNESRTCQILKKALMVMRLEAAAV